MPLGVSEAFFHLTANFNYPMLSHPLGPDVRSW